MILHEKVRCGPGQPTSAIHFAYSVRRRNRILSNSEMFNDCIRGSHLMWTIFWFLTILASAKPASAKCDLRVAVFGYDGKPKEAYVRVAKDDGSWMQQVLSYRGIANFCDIGVGMFSVRVGSEACGQVEVRMLQVGSIQSRYIPVYYENCHLNPVRTGCSVLLRIVNGEAVPIVGASASFGRWSRSPDEYGRVFLAGTKSGYQVTVKAPGFVEKTVVASCAANEQDREIPVVLEKVP